MSLSPFDTSEMILYEAAVAKVVAANLSASRDARAVKLIKPDHDGCTVIFVHPSTRKRGSWQLTWCDWREQPSGHVDHFTSRDDAVRSASGAWLGESPYGSKDYRVVETR